VQVGLRRLVGWLAVGQVGFLALALVDARGPGGEALVQALLATGLAIVGVLTTLSSLSHHERACEHVGDLAGMSSQSPTRATLLALFLLSLAGFPGTMGFVARRDVLTAVEHAGHRGWLLAGVVATVLALTAVGRPLIAMLRPNADPRAASRALTNEQVVLAVCGTLLLYLGMAPLFGEQAISGSLAQWIATGVASLRGQATS
jgi:NADH-quinone oxidoreductase subunit N